MPSATTFEILQDGKWTVIDVKTALDGGMRYGRCIECLQPVRAYLPSRGNHAVYVIHTTHNPVCSLSERA